jgi:hypothetical protein
MRGTLFNQHQPSINTCASVSVSPRRLKPQQLLHRCRCPSKMHEKLGILSLGARNLPSLKPASVHLA